VKQKASAEEIAINQVANESKDTTKEYSRNEVANHATADDCWMVYKNKVYDVTKFINQHPAGANYLTDYAGADTSVEFDQAGHSEAASKWMEEWKIGKVPADEMIDHAEGAIASPDTT
jgi:cytochrome b involved in lipid metabolism